MVKNTPANAGVMDSIPGLGKFHMLQDKQACVPQLLNPCFRTHAPQQEKPPSEKPTHSQLESAHSSEDPAQPTINK